MLGAFETWVVALAEAARREDGPDAVVAVIRAFLAEQVSYAAGEVRWLRPAQPLCWPLTDHAEDDGLVADDVVAYAVEHEAPLRIDDQADARAFPRTLERLRRRERHSVLVLPLLPAGPDNGAVVLVRAERCGFAGTSLYQLGPLVRVAGVCLDLAVRLGALRREVAALRPASGDSLRLQQSLQALHEDLVATRRARDAAEARCRALADAPAASLPAPPPAPAAATEAGEAPPEPPPAVPETSVPQTANDPSGDEPTGRVSHHRWKRRRRHR